MSLSTLARNDSRFLGRGTAGTNEALQTDFVTWHAFFIRVTTQAACFALCVGFFGHWDMLEFAVAEGATFKGRRLC